MTTPTTTVPKEPTEAMIEAGWEATGEAQIFAGDERNETMPGWRLLDGEVSLSVVYRAMLAAAPVPSPHGKEVRRWDVTDHGVATEDEVEQAIVTLGMEDAVLAYRLQGYIALLTPAGEGWRPIESAPRDGTRFLACGGGLDKAVETCSWSENVACWNLETYTADDRDDEPDGYCRPTHWMPLPEAPSVGVQDV